MNGIHIKKIALQFVTTYHNEAGKQSYCWQGNTSTLTVCGLASLSKDIWSEQLRSMFGYFLRIWIFVELVAWVLLTTYIMKSMISFFCFGKKYIYIYIFFLEMIDNIQFGFDCQKKSTPVLWKVFGVRTLIPFTKQIPFCVRLRVRYSHRAGFSATERCIAIGAGFPTERCK